MSAALVCGQGTYRRGLRFVGTPRSSSANPDRQCQRGRWSSHFVIAPWVYFRSGDLRRFSSDWQIFCPLAPENPVQSEDGRFAATLFHQPVDWDLRVFHRLDSKNAAASFGSASNSMTYGLIAICPYVSVFLISALELFLSCCGYQGGVVFRLSLGRRGLGSWVSLTEIGIVVIF